MRKFTIVLCLIGLFSSNLFAGLVVRDLNLVVNASNTQVGLDFDNDSQDELTFNFFIANGAISISGKLLPDFTSMMAVEPIGGGNYTPKKIYNNSSFNTEATWNKSPIFIHNPSLTFQNPFLGTGKQYIGIRKVNSAKDTLYAWLLVELNVNGTELTIIKLGFDDTFNEPVLTGLEGENNPVGINKIENNISVNLFPQPAKDILNIQMENGFDISSYEISEMGGKVICSAALNFNKTIDVSSLPSGMYLLRITSGQKGITRKFLVE